MGRSSSVARRWGGARDDREHGDEHEHGVEGRSKTTSLHLGNQGITGLGLEAVDIAITGLIHAPVDDAWDPEPLSALRFLVRFNLETLR